MKLTRRTILASALPALAAAQTPPASDTPDYIAISVAQYNRNAAALAKVPVPMETEPAFHFKPD